jgi:hypothetical protein
MADAVCSLREVAHLTLPQDRGYAAILPIPSEDHTKRDVNSQVARACYF